MTKLRRGYFLGSHDGAIGGPLEYCGHRFVHGVLI